MTTETLIKQNIRRYLGIKGWFCFPVRQGLGSYKGIPDLIACKGGVTLFLEVKSPKGKQSEYQKRFQWNIVQSGCRYILVRSVQDLVEMGI